MRRRSAKVGGKDRQGHGGKEARKRFDSAAAEAEEVEKGTAAKTGATKSERILY